MRLSKVRQPKQLANSNRLEEDLFFGVCPEWLQSNSFNPVLIQTMMQDKNLKAIKSFIRKKEDVNVVGPQGYTPLMIASITGNVEGVKLLLAAGARVNDQTKEGYTSVWLAALKGYSDIVTLLAKKGADLEVLDKKNQQTPLMVAADYGRIDCVRALIKAGADVNYVSHYGQTALSYAIIGRAKNIDIVKKLVSAGADIAQEPKGGERIHALKPLVLATLHRNVPAVKFLLSKGALGVEKALDFAKEREMRDIEDVILKSMKPKKISTNKMCVKNLQQRQNDGI